MKLKKVREGQGLSQTDLAKKAGVSRAYVFRLEAGGSDPTVGVLQRLAKALGVSVTALLE
jgi:transcriptional regulator with XRE-family HTH domain